MIGPGVLCAVEKYGVSPPQFSRDLRSPAKGAFRPSLPRVVLHHRMDLWGLCQVDASGIKPIDFDHKQLDTLLWSCRL
jgi:hypothetical protein